ncbi:NKL protein, partial [Rhinopomastus cyanomelas]|nr:NKL protein [Rhinopomastus cyanomelas]
RGKLCTLCTKVLQRLEAKAGQKPDQDKVKMTLDKGCQALGQPLASTCRWLVKKFRQKVRVALQTGELPQKFCTALRLCK